MSDTAKPFGELPTEERLKDAVAKRVEAVDHLTRNGIRRMVEAAYLDGYAQGFMNGYDSGLIREFEDDAEPAA